jgi:hypothetical protein
MSGIIINITKSGGEMNTIKLIVIFIAVSASICFAQDKKNTYKPMPFDKQSYDLLMNKMQTSGDAMKVKYKSKYDSAKNDEERFKIALNITRDNYHLAGFDYDKTIINFSEQLKAGRISLEFNDDTMSQVTYYIIDSIKNILNNTFKNNLRLESVFKKETVDAIHNVIELASDKNTPFNSKSYTKGSTIQSESAKVLDHVLTDKFSYIYCEIDNDKYWLALSKTNLTKGNIIAFDPSSGQKNYSSKSTGLVYKNIYFPSNIRLVQ